MSLAIYTFQGNEDCVALEIKLNGWNDRPCSDSLTFVCEGVPNGNRKKGDNICPSLETLLNHN